jgi:hypothetical protein
VGIDPYFFNPKRQRCARCGEVAKGSAWINGDRYCHDDDPYPTCYMLTQSDRLVGQGPLGPAMPFDEVLAYFGLTHADLD